MAVGQRLVGRAGFGALLMLRGQGGDFLPAQKSEKLQVTHHVAVVGANPELVEAIHAGFPGVQPNGAGGGLAELGAVAVEDQRQSQPEDVRAGFLAVNSMPAVMLPHWSLPPICNSHLCAWNKWKKSKACSSM
jgi:hypothetical protein